MEQKEKAILVGVNLRNQEDFLYSMEELENLAIALDIEVVGSVTQNLNHIQPSHYIGKGKVLEVKNYIEYYQADLVIFNDELSATQIRNLEKELNISIMDRSSLILEMFSRRAKTKESRLQVEIAKLNYQLPRLVGQGEGLDRQRGGAVLNRGAGEKKIETDKRKILDRISDLNKELETSVQMRRTQRMKRQKSSVPVVAFVGYTNAGKSTIMNALVDTYKHKQDHKKVFEKDMLFATLDTSVRNITLSDNKSLLITDTVGFISKLPHHLIKAFRSTLEEVQEADVLVHVVDYSNDNYEELMKTTEETLHELGITDIPIITAYNKSDLVEIKIPQVKSNSIYLSAKLKIGLEELINLIRGYVFKDYVICEMLIPYDQGNIISYFNEQANVLSTQYEFNGTKLKIECKKQDYDKYQDYIIE